MMLPRTTFCMFCDDVRQEINSKTSYIGAYPSAVAFPPNPPPEALLLMSKLVVLVWLIVDINDKVESTTITVSIPPGQTEIFRQEIPPEQLTPPAPEGDWLQRYSLHVALPFINLVLPHEGFIEVNVETEQGKISAGRLKVVAPGRPDPATLSGGLVLSSPTASPPPSEQSPPAAPATRTRRVPRRSSTRRTPRTPEPE
jgi:hypothetical protein